MKEKWKHKYTSNLNSDTFLQMLEQMKENDEFDNSFWKRLFYAIRDKKTVFLNKEAKIEIIRKFQSYFQ